MAVFHKTYIGPGEGTSKFQKGMDVKYFFESENVTKIVSIGGYPNSKVPSPSNMHLLMEQPCVKYFAKIWLKFLFLHTRTKSIFTLEMK